MMLVFRPVHRRISRILPRLGLRKVGIEMRGVSYSRARLKIDRVCVYLLSAAECCKFGDDISFLSTSAGFGL
jgi:hypothetical protein